ncbi:MAG: hypothetical protein LBN93_03625 [Candidatus Symbiothrix sp.]|nr:hypothetical protein [Candidatus Symbiothrix sp.]
MKTFNFRRLRIKSAMTVALLVACVLVTGNCSPVTAQVAIGGDGTVTPGALLDLSQVTDVGGLLLPQIVSADTATAVLKKPGMLVYNKTDGKIYAYNGSAWSAGGGSGGSGGGGGGGEPDPTPSPKTCGGSVMGVSGNLYPIGSYPYAQNDLKNLCWTLTNLLEAGASFTSYTGKAEVRGYYYGSGVASIPGNDICEQSVGSQWRVPNMHDWELLQGGMGDLTYAESNYWVGAPNALAGRRSTITRCNGGIQPDIAIEWDVSSFFLIGGAGYPKVSITPGVQPTFVYDFLTETHKCPGGDPNFISNYIDHVSIRCVRDL